MKGVLCVIRLGKLLKYQLDDVEIDDWQAMEEQVVNIVTLYVFTAKCH